MHIRSSKLHFQVDLSLILFFVAFLQCPLAYQNKIPSPYQEYRCLILILKFEILVLTPKHQIHFPRIRIFQAYFSSFHSCLPYHPLHPFHCSLSLVYQSKLSPYLIFPVQLFPEEQHFFLPLCRKAISLFSSLQHYMVHQSN